MSHSASTVADVMALISCLKNALCPTLVGSSESDSSPLHDLNSDDESEDYQKELVQETIAQLSDENYEIASVAVAEDEKPTKKRKRAQTPL
ncbi:hypothetical protein SK128_001405 [Halocaridina rubra]|uniref:Uncharacterized protein n=1 Tax=Halocaridina rubra TaxID=373956 RepID=A0AAN9AHU8_HALRR